MSLIPAFNRRREQESIYQTMGLKGLQAIAEIGLPLGEMIEKMISEEKK